MRRIQLLKGLFTVVVVLGGGIIVMGVVLEPVLPYFQVDVVLSPAEVRDPKIRKQTLDVLQRARGNLGPLWTILGLILTGVGGLGLRTATRFESEWGKGPVTEAH